MLEATDYVLYNAAAIFYSLNCPQPGEILLMLRIKKEALTFDDVLLIPAHLFCSA
ncbi:inosine 5'-monophosphate dehydrogenase [Photorhabdus temperata subsp. temperata M1021]|nr:inosine 5'-monophosphate dehydrogenase [Photorhabdus temperata subsp. temperata M1021]